MTAELERAPMAAVALPVAAGRYGGLPNEAVIGLYLQAMRAERKADNTITRHRWVVNSLADHLAPTLLVEARYPHLLSWQMSLAHLSAGSVAGYVSTVRTFYRWRVRPMRILDVSPAEELVVPRVPTGRPRPVTEQHLQIAVACTPDPMMRAWLYLGAYAGLRCCEIAALQGAWIIDGDVPRLHIVGKGQKERAVHIGPQILALLVPYRHRQGHVFTWPDGRPYTPRYVSRRINEHLHGLGLPYTAHQLRHRYGTRALELTKNIRVVQEQMGHSSPATTQLYTLVNQEEAKDLAQRLDGEVRDSRA